MKRVIRVCSASLVLFLAACSLAPAGPARPETQSSFEVPAGQKHTVALDLKKDEELQATFSVSGRENYLDLYVKGPGGELVYGVVRVQGSHSFRLKASTSGTHTLYFDNSFSFGSARQVSLSMAVR